LLLYFLNTKFNYLENEEDVTPTKEKTAIEMVDQPATLEASIEEHPAGVSTRSKTGILNENYRDPPYRDPPGSVIFLSSTGMRFLNRNVALRVRDDHIEHD
jgi:hypothetical protein